MQFVKLNEFKLPPAKQVKTSFLNDKKSNKIEKPKIICASFSAPQQILTCGLSDGSIIQFMNQKYNNKKLTESKDYEVRNYNSLPNIHKGQIRCLLSQKIFNQLFVITGSADRTIKIWDTQVKSKSIVQTLTGHTGTIICLSYSKKSDTLFSGSNDKSIRIWKQDEGRKFFMYPWYVCYQVLLDFSPKKMDKPIYPTSFQIHDGQISNFILYVGDSAGNLHIIRQYQIQGVIEEGQGKSKTGFQIDRSNYSHHRLHINSIIYIPKEHLVVTTGYDQYIYGFQSLSQKLTLKYANPKKCLFTQVIWVQNLIVASDQQGSFYCIQLSSDKGIQQIKKYNKCINHIFVSAGEVFTVTDDGVDVFKIIRGIKTVQGQNCHTDTILRLYSLEAYRLTDKKIKDQAKIISISLDNSMRVWDPNDLTCLQVLQNPQKAQISSLFYLKRANLFVTGHQNGIVRLWNIELQTSITVSQQNSTFAHNNTVCSFAEYIHIRGKQDITEYLFSTGYQGKINVWQIFLKKSSVQSSLISSSICPQLKYSFFPQQMQESPDKIGFQLFALQIWENKSKGNEQNQISILSAGSKGFVYFTWMFTYQTYKKIKIHNDSINCLLIDQNILFTGSYDNTIKLTLLETMQFLSVLSVHQSALTRLQIIEETGHLISQSCQGQILFWDYPEQKVVKKIKQKKENIKCSCYVDESQMMYVGTQCAKILTFSLADIYSKPVNKSAINKKQQEDDISQESLKNMMEKNEQMLKQLKGQ